MYHRLGQLEVRGFIEVDRKARRGRALARITGKGRAAIEVREDLLSTEERSA
jgi:DNA-binding PadR family transcriptional regulator